MIEDNEIKRQEFTFQMRVILISLISVYGISSFAFSSLHWNEMVLGWSLAFLKHLTDEIIKQISLKKEAKTAIYYLSGFNFLRFILLLVLVFCMATLLPIHTYAFIYALLAGYVVFINGRILHFYQLNKNKL